MVRGLTFLSSSSDENRYFYICRHEILDLTHNPIKISHGSIFPSYNSPASMKIPSAVVVCYCALVGAALLMSVASGQNLPLPPLPYSYDALEPVISEATLRVHHLGHHQAYTNKLNAALAELRSDVGWPPPHTKTTTTPTTSESPRQNRPLTLLPTQQPVTKPIAKRGIDKILESLDEVADPAMRAALRNNGGGYVNHDLFWKVMAPVGQGGEPSKVT